MLNMRVARKNLGLRAGYVDVAGRERGASEENVVTFADPTQNILVTWLLCKHSKHMATDTYATRMRVSICEISTSADTAITTK
jgi:hypothetical protein